MVGYGSALKLARRQGWEEAYLDYDSLKELLMEMEELDSISKKRNQRDVFFQTLQSEIEKISLYALAKQGALANDVGALRFQHNKRTDSKFSIFGGASLFCVGTQRAGTDMGRTQTQAFAKDRSCLPPRPPRREATEIDQGLNSAEHTETEQALETYTLLGVEVLHLIRFICFNAMAVRKILKKHEKIHSSTTQQQDEDTDSLDIHPTSSNIDSSALDTPVAGNRAGPDYHFQLLANSASIAAIHSSLYAAFLQCKDRTEEILSPSLDTYQSNHSPTHRHQRTLSPFEFQMGHVLKEEQQSPSESSLIRLECVIESIQTLREFAQLIVNQPFSVFLSKKAMVVTGDILGDGLDMNTKRALEVLLRFEPDYILSMNDEDLSNWQTSSMTTKMSDDPIGGRSRGLTMEGIGREWERGSKWGGVDSASLIINLLSTLLYTVNYYIIAPTANHYAILLGTDGAFGATLVGASSLAALFGAFLYSAWYTRASFQSALIFSALSPCLGNLLYATALSYHSMPMALWGRVLVGFGSAEVINRQLISSCVSFSTMTKACAFFVAAGAVGMSIGPLLAAILDELSGRDVDVDLRFPGMPAGGFIVNHATSPGFLMAILWLAELVALLFVFSEPDRINGGGLQENKSEQTRFDTPHLETSQRLPGFSFKGSIQNSTYGSVEAPSTQVAPGLPKDASSGRCFDWKGLRSELNSIQKLIFDNMALPVTLFLFAYIELVDEVLISSCSMVCLRYFNWHASRAGFLIASLGALVLPAHFVVERASHFYEERTIMKNSIIFICISLFAILNYTGFLYDSVGLGVEVVEDIESKQLGAESKRSSIGTASSTIASLTNKENEFSYDWGAGKVVYIVFLSAIFMGTIILEGVDTSLMSKATPAKLNDTMLNSGLLATLVGTLGRVCGDSMITASAFVDKSVFTDFVNATFVPLIPIALLGFYLVKTYYKLLV